MNERWIEFGAELKKQRLDRGVGLDEIARITKVRRVFLENIEEGRLNELPDEVFTIGFLRAYAKHLGLDDRAIITHYNMVSEGKKPQSPPLLPKPEKRFHVWPYMLAVLLLGCGYGAYWMIELRSHGPAPAAVNAAALPLSTAPQPAQPPQEPAEETLPDEASDEPAVLQPDTPGPMQLPTTGEQDEEQTTGQADVPTGNDLVIQTSEACWAEIWKGSYRIVYRLIESGEKLSFQGNDFTMTFGNRKAVSVIWKGAPVAPPEGDSPVISKWQIPPRPPGEGEQR